MATANERLERVIEREAATWGTRPVPPEHRRLSGIDFAVLWGDLSIGLLVMLTGAFLVPALGLPVALVAIVAGTLLGCIPLALVGLVGSREGLPGMVLFRPVLGRRGSYVPSVLNIAQLVGWTGFEFWVMSLVADQVSVRLFGFSSYWLWLGVVASISTALALGGPILVVRRWLERFGAWVVAGVGLWITFRVVSTADLGAMWTSPGAGGLRFWLGVDLAIALPVSWVPLVADYNRFARRGVTSAAGTYWGYAAGNIWFYALGASLVLGAGLTDLTPAGVGEALTALAGGVIVLLALLAGETDEAFADIYSAAVSAQNLNERVPQRAAVVAVAVAGVALAALLGLRPSIAFATYEAFLFLLGSVFVPLFGVFVAHYFVVRRRSGPSGLQRARDAAADGDGGPLDVRAFAAWLIGFLIYQWSVPTGPAVWTNAIETLFGQWLGLSFPLGDSVAGASIPSFAAALVLYVAFNLASGGRAKRRSPSRG